MSDGIKSQVLGEIAELMDQLRGDGLKSRFKSAPHTEPLDEHSTEDKPEEPESEDDIRSLLELYKGL